MQETNRNLALPMLFALLMGASVLAMAAGLYLGITLGMASGGILAGLSALGILLWLLAWGGFCRMCSSLRRGESAFTPATGRTLQCIGLCMLGLAAVTVLCTLLGGTRAPMGVFLLEAVGLPCVFLFVAMVARILRGLLVHAMALEAEQEGVV